VLGGCLAGLGKFAEAEPLLLDGYFGMKDNPKALWLRKREALECIAKLYADWSQAEPGKGYDAKAAEWRVKLKAWQAATQPTAPLPGPPAEAPPAVPPR